MFATLSNLRNRTTFRGLAILAAAGGILTLAATSDAAEPWHWRGRGHDRVVIVARPTPSVVISAPRPPVIVTTVPDVVPSDLHMSAYQSRDTVIVLITGCNPSTGYTTALTGVERAGDGCPTIVMRNTPCGDAAVATLTQFSLNASVHSYSPISTVMVRVAGQVYQVPVTQVQALS